MTQNQGVKAEEVEAFRDIYGDPPEEEDEDDIIFKSPSKNNLVSAE